jgi:hypothetical protein
MCCRGAFSARGKNIDTRSFFLVAGCLGLNLLALIGRYCIVSSLIIRSAGLSIPLKNSVGKIHDRRVDRDDLGSYARNAK